MNYEIRIPIFSSEFIDIGAGLVLSIWFALALVLNSKNNFIIAKLTFGCGVAIMNGQIVNAYVFTDVCQQIAYMVKQLNYVWLTAGITV